MTRPYSMDLRERVVAAVAEGRLRRAVARLFRLGEATVIRWAKRHATTGSVAARPMGGLRHDVLGIERAWLRARMAAVPDLTVRALRAELLAERGLRASYDAVWRFLRDEGLTFKKRMARPVCKRFPRSSLVSLRQRIRSRSNAPAKMEIRAFWSS